MGLTRPRKSGTVRGMRQATVAEYVLQRLSALGIDRVFGVPGDYAFSVDNAVEKVEGLDWVGCANELNAAYAADGYARIRGAAILSTTYGVGELSALNGVMGAKAHRVPVFHIVGMPSERIQHLRLITHHNLGDTRYDRFQDISATACCVSAVLTPDNCIDELERVIREALRQSMPAYIVISQVNGLMPVIGTPVEGAPLDTNDKGVIDESLPQYIGLYAAQNSRPAGVCDIVEQADLILDIGGVLLTELNTGLWGAVLDTTRAICIHDNWVRSGTDVYLNVAIEDVIEALTTEVTPRTREPGPTPEALAMVGSGDEPTSSAGFYPRLQRRLRTGDTLLIETGTCMLHLNGMHLPAGVGAEGQGLWGSIGWATPAALGVALAKRSGRTWLVTGDGSHQLTLNELAVMGRYGADPVIFVLNNGIYGIEDVISERGHAYDDLAPVQYHLLPAAFGCQGWLSAKVTTIAELDEILDAIESHDGAAYIEVMIPEAESQPLPREVIDRGYKLQTPKPT